MPANNAVNKLGRAPRTRPPRNTPRTRSGRTPYLKPYNTRSQARDALRDAPGRAPCGVCGTRCASLIRTHPYHARKMERHSMSIEHRFTVTVTSTNPSVEALTDRLRQELKMVLGDDVTVHYDGRLERTQWGTGLVEANQ